MQMLKVAILDDYAGIALESADWSSLDGLADITVFRAHLAEEEAIAALQPFDILCTVRERMALPRRLFEHLPNLKLVTIIGTSLPNLDMDAATEHGVLIIHPDADRAPVANIANATPELGADDLGRAQSRA
jgi:phosphoglycerate dehydrogenase-like enzyme